MTTTQQVIDVIRREWNNASSADDLAEKVGKELDIEKQTVLNILAILSNMNRK